MNLPVFNLWLRVTRNQFPCNVPASRRLLALDQGSMAERSCDEHRVNSKETEGGAKPSSFLLPPNIHQLVGAYTKLRAEELCPVLQLTDQKQIRTAGCVHNITAAQTCSTLS